jgi:hypothetical protein
VGVPVATTWYMDLMRGLCNGLFAMP